MTRTVSLPVVLITFIVMAAALFVVFTRIVNPPPDAHPGMEDIPPRNADSDKPVAPPKDAGPVPGAIKR
jgi:hypothetical protein